MVPARYCRQANWLDHRFVAAKAAPAAITLNKNNLDKFLMNRVYFGVALHVAQHASKTAWVLYGQASRAISTG